MCKKQWAPWPSPHTLMMIIIENCNCAHSRPNCFLRLLHSTKTAVFIITTSSTQSGLDASSRCTLLHFYFFPFPTDSSFTFSICRRREEWPAKFHQLHFYFDRISNQFHSSLLLSSLFILHRWDGDKNGISWKNTLNSTVQFLEKSSSARAV